MERNKESQNAALTELQNEMKSLKSLLVSRRPAVEQVSSAPSTPTGTTTTTTTTNTPAPVTSSPTDGLSSRLAATINGTGNRAGIPAWQMASQSSSSPSNSNTTTSNTNETNVEASGSSSTNAN